MVTDLVLLACVGIRPVMVHGGGPEINSWLAKLGIEAVFKNGLRVTDGVRAAPLGGRAGGPAGRAGAGAPRSAARAASTGPGARGGRSLCA